MSGFNGGSGGPYSRSSFPNNNYAPHGYSHPPSYPSPQYAPPTHYQQPPYNSNGGPHAPYQTNQRYNNSYPNDAQARKAGRRQMQLQAVARKEESDGE